MKIPYKVDQAGAALAMAKRLSLVYHPSTGKDDEERIVEVHTIGISKTGKHVMRVWQVSGGSVSEEPEGWKLLKFEDIDNLKLLDTDSLAPREGYKRGDKGMSLILEEI